MPKDYFARLVFVFTYAVEVEEKRTVIPMALVQPFTDISTPFRKKDIELRLLRLKEKPREKSIIIPARSIIRGAYIVPDGDKKADWLVVDIIDSDMFLRMHALYPSPNK
jgi:hypothetical protein